MPLDPLRPEPVWWRYVVILGDTANSHHVLLPKAQEAAEALASVNPDIPVSVCERIGGVMVKLLRQREVLPDPRSPNAR